MTRAGSAEPAQRGRVTCNDTPPMRAGMVIKLRPRGPDCRDRRYHVVPAYASFLTTIQNRHASGPDGAGRTLIMTASAYCAVRAVFPKVISGLRKPIAIQAAISFNMNLPE
jgi:hypothetical protein